MRVTEVSRICGVSERTLRYYDGLGLLSPTRTGAGGYRAYAQADLERLQQILFLREMGFALSRITQILKDPGFDRRAALRAQAEHMDLQAARFGRMAELARRTLASLEGGVPMKNEELFTDFDLAAMEEHQNRYEQETRDRWGDTQAYRESKRRTSAYSKEDWAAVKADSEAAQNELCACFHAGLPVQDARVKSAVGACRGVITKYFYPCTLQIFRGLGAMYVQDERFAKYYEKLAPGLAAYYSRAIAAYCDEQSE